MTNKETTTSTFTECVMCGSSDLERLGHTCEEAREEGLLRSIDYYGDGSKVAHIGAHHVGYRCRTCGFLDGDVCIHD